MATQIRILKSELEDVHFAFERGATSNTWYHIINRRTCEQIFTMVQRGGAWCAIRGNGGFQQFLRKIRNNVDSTTKTIYMTSDDIGRLRRYVENYGFGGFQGRLNGVLKDLNIV